MTWSMSVYLTQDTPAHISHSLVQLLHHQQTETWQQCASYRGTWSNDTHMHRRIQSQYTHAHTYTTHACTIKFLGLTCQPQCVAASEQQSPLFSSSPSPVPHCWLPSPHQLPMHHNICYIPSTKDCIGTLPIRTLVNSDCWVIILF